MLGDASQDQWPALGCVCVYACVGVRVYVCTSGLHKCEPLHMWVGVKIYVHEHVWIAHTCV